MVQAINSVGRDCPYLDPEYRRIIQELLALGLTPTGNKSADKAKLEAKKQELARKIQEKMETKQPDMADMQQRSQLETQKLGAMNVAELNKILHGLS